MGRIERGGKSINQVRNPSQKWWFFVFQRMIFLTKTLIETNMDDEDILEMVADGELEPDQIEDFKELSDEAKELVADGSLTAEEVIDLGL